MKTLFGIIPGMNKICYGLLPWNSIIDGKVQNEQVLLDSGVWDIGYSPNQMREFELKLSQYIKAHKDIVTICLPSKLYNFYSALIYNIVFKVADKYRVKVVFTRM